MIELSLYSDIFGHPCHNFYRGEKCKIWPKLGFWAIFFQNEVMHSKSQTNTEAQMTALCSRKNFV